MYDPSIGRFTSVDPTGFAAGDANLYRAEGDNPTNRVDPSGLAAYPEEPIGGLYQAQLQLRGFPNKDAEDDVRRGVSISLERIRAALETLADEENALKACNNNFEGGKLEIKILFEKFESVFGVEEFGIDWYKKTMRAILKWAEDPKHQLVIIYDPSTTTGAGGYTYWIQRFNVNNLYFYITADSLPKDYKCQANGEVPSELVSIITHEIGRLWNIMGTDKTDGTDSLNSIDRWDHLIEFLNDQWPALRKIY
jgi:hypothetical protein